MTKSGNSSRARKGNKTSSHTVNIRLNEGSAPDGPKKRKRVEAESVAEAENNPKTGGRIPMMAERSRRTADNNHHKARPALLWVVGS